MSREEEIKSTLQQMSELLLNSDMGNWAVVLTNIKSYVDINPEEAYDQIAGLYGGMGSLNDIVLYKEDRLLINENDIFDVLRNRLYELSVYYKRNRTY